MLIHLSPTLLTNSTKSRLVDLCIPQLGLKLREGKQLATRRPFPNKRYQVACARIGTRAIDGILIECPEHMPEFSMIARWEVTLGVVVTHQVDYVVRDTEHEAVSDKMLLWYSRPAREGMPGWNCRFPENLEGTPAEMRPRMDVDPNSGRKGKLRDEVLGSLLVSRHETFELPTIEPERILQNREWGDRLPLLGMAFKAMAV